MIRTGVFGRTAAGEEVKAYTLVNGCGAELTVLDFGGTIHSLKVPSQDGSLVDVVLGYDSVEGYEQGDGYLGATIGRVGNRIAKGKFSLNGRDYSLYINDGENHLHGGKVGFDRRMWKGEISEGRIDLSCFSPDGEEGYPGNLSVRVSFLLSEDNELRIVYEAETDANTPVSLTNHSYFNLNGGGSVLSQLLTVSADSFLENDGGCLPTGKLLPVDGPFDFRVEKPIGRDIGMADEQLLRAGGYDHNYVLSSTKAARLRSEESGIVMTVETDLPGMQVYSSNFLTKRAGKNGSEMDKNGAICLETQFFPNAINYTHFASPVLKAGEKLHTETAFKFTVE